MIRNRKDTKKVFVGNVQIGNSEKVVIQSMTTTKTKNIKETVEQIQRLEKEGCQIVRIAVLDMEDAKSISIIKNKINIPLVADIHFDYRLALESIEQGIDKIRLNPGNINNEEKIKEIVDKCKEKKIPIRIGINSGSLEKHILDKYNYPTVQGMIESAKFHVNLLEKYDFEDIIISLKSSNIDLAIQAYTEASKIFKYPLHIGITEAGTKFSGTIKSSIGLGILLNSGIGSTIRVSLSTDPVEEIKVCKEILKNFGLAKNIPTIISCPTCGRLQFDLFKIVNEVELFLQDIKSDIKVAVMGCAVNGPGEAREADFGIAGGKNEGLLFRKGKIIKKVPQKDMLLELKKEILNFIEKK